jgi:hypothetical protein
MVSDNITARLAKDEIMIYDNIGARMMCGTTMSPASRL